MAKKKSSFEIDSAFGTYAKDAKIDAVTDKVIDSLNAEIKSKPLALDLENLYDHLKAPGPIAGDTYLNRMAKKNTFKDAVVFSGLDALDKEIHNKPVTFKEQDLGNAGCEKTTAGPINAANYSGYKAGKDYYKDEYCNAVPTPGISYPEDGETNQYDAEIVKTKYGHVTAIIIGLALCGVAAYIVHAELIVKLSGN